MTELRDERLRKALDHAPDSHLAPDPRARLAIKNIAVRALQPAAAVPAGVPWWRRFWPAAGAGRMPWNAAFATVLVAGFVTLLWQDQPVPDARRDEPAPAAALPPARQEPAPPAAPRPPGEARAPESSGAGPAAVPAPAPPRQPEPPRAPQKAADAAAERRTPVPARERAAPAPAPAPEQPELRASSKAAAAPEPLARPAAPAADAMKKESEVAESAPAAARAPQAGAADTGLARSAPPGPAPAAPAAAAMVPVPVPAPAAAAAPAAPATRSEAAPAQSARDAPRFSGGLLGRAAAPSRDLAVLEGWTGLRVGQEGQTRYLAREDSGALMALLRGVAPTSGAGELFPGPITLRIEVVRGEEVLGVLEFGGEAWVRWSQLRPGFAGRWSVQAEGPRLQALQALQAELRRLGLLR